MNQTVLITGGTGVIGQHLTRFLIQNGYQVSCLSRSKKAVPGVRMYLWDVEKGQIDPEAIQSADHIIHLAGAGIADERWTDKRKREILESRTKSTQLIAQTLERSAHHVKTFVSASAIGYYGGDTGDELMNENSPAGTDFLAQVVKAWEASVEAVSSLGIRTVMLRTGIVLTKEGGALPKLVQPVRLGAGAPLGTGRQYMSWIHIDDLCGLYMQAIQKGTFAGKFNVVAPQPVTNSEFVRLIAKRLNRPLLLPNVPSFAIRLLFGEMAIVVLGSSRVDNQRIREEGEYNYRYASLDSALGQLLEA